jgi:predicted neuraminidase
MISQQRLALLFTGMLFAAGVAGSSPLAAAEQNRLTVVGESLVFRHTGTDPKDPANGTGFNHGPTVAALPDGRLLAAWFSGAYEGAANQKIMAAYSSDQGKTWTPAHTLQDFSDCADFDPALFVAGDQTFLFFAAARKPIEVFYRRSGDSGRTWAEPVGLGQENHTTRANGIRLSTGELLAPLHRRGTKAGGVMKSTDGGRTWRRFGAVATPAGEGGEPTIAELKSGKIMMVLRTRDGELWRALSSDKGETWSAPEKTGLTGTSSAAHLLRTRDGTLVLTHNPSRAVQRYPLTVRTSDDEGVTWSSPLILANRPEEKPGWSVTYPTATELPDGSVLVVWTEIRSTAQVKYGDIHAARLQLRPAK